MRCGHVLHHGNGAAIHHSDLLCCSSAIGALLAFVVVRSSMTIFAHGQCKFDAQTGDVVIILQNQMSSNATWPAKQSEPV